MVDVTSLPDLTRLAIEAALRCDWQKALDINLEISEKEPENVDCLNRLARAYFELGKLNMAKKIYDQVLKLDPYNTIAQKNLKRVTTVKKANVFANGANSNGLYLSPSLFIEEPGLTKIVTLVKAAEPQKLLTLSSGTEVKLVPKNRGVTVTCIDNSYIGVMPDDTSHHLTKLIKGGNKYQAYIKSVKSNSVVVLIRETFRAKKFKNQASFLDDAKVVTYSSDHLSLISDDIDRDLQPQSESEEELTI